MTSIIERDALVGNLLDKVDELERRIRYMEDTHPGVGGEAAGKLAYYREDGSMHMPGLLYSEENAVWGYYDRWLEQVVNASSAAGTVFLETAAVPAGYVYVAHCVSAIDQVTNPTDIHIGINIGGARYYFNRTPTPGINIRAFFIGEQVFKAGDKACATFAGCALHDVLVAEWWGYKMRVV